MDTYTGHIEYKLTGQESKSEGFTTCLINSAGTSYRLYRKGAFEINDSFFKQFDQQEVEINGELENLVPESPLPADLVFQPKEESDDGTDCTDDKKEPANTKPTLILKKKKKSNNNFKRRKK